MTNRDLRPQDGPQTQGYVFGHFRADATRRMLYGPGGEPIPLTSRVFDTLLYLVRNHQRVIEKDELMREIWPDTIVEENNLNKNISILRRALGESKKEHRFIVTIPGRGFQFVADVHELGETGKKTEVDGLLVDEKEEFETEAPSELAESPAAAAGHGHGRPARYRFWSLSLAAVILVVVIVGLILWRGGRQPLDPPIRTLAVLPFQSLVPESRDEALELGMADALINKISSSDAIIVRPLSSVRRYERGEKDSMHAGRELGVDSVLEGTIQTSGGRTRVAARLIRTSDGKQLWTAQFDEDSGHIFDLQDSISERVLVALTVKLGGEAQRRLRKRDTENVEAYQLYMKGRFHHSKLIMPETTKAQALYRQAIALDPNYALAYAALTQTYLSFALTGDIDPAVAMREARSASSRAIALDETLAEAQVASGMVDFWYDWNWSEAEKKCRRAIELDPNDPAGYFLCAHLSSNLGEHQKAITLGRRARELNPLSLIVNSVEGQSHYFAGNLDEALARFNRTLELEPNFWHSHLVLSFLYAEREMYPQAIAAAERAAQVSGRNSQALAAKSYALAKSGELAHAREVLAQLQALSSTRYVPPYSLAIAYSGFGDSERTLDALEKGFAEKDALMVFLKVDRRWNSLRNHPRFQKLIEQMNFR